MGDDHDLHPRAEDPVARVIFVLMHDRLPVGDIEAAIEKARATLKSVPPSAIGLVACELAERIHTAVA